WDMLLVPARERQLGLVPGGQRGAADRQQEVVGRHDQLGKLPGQLWRVSASNGRRVAAIFGQDQAVEVARPVLELSADNPAPLFGRCRHGASFRWEVKTK